VVVARRRILGRHDVDGVVDLDGGELGRGRAERILVALIVRDREAGRLDVVDGGVDRERAVGAVAAGSSSSVSSV